ncbi:MAG: NAD-dependent epimerase/dehydratase family protein [Syntrophaceae bacterium]
MSCRTHKNALILITGATGAVGPLVVEAFHAAGYLIRTLSIDPPPAGSWPNYVETRIGNITDESAVLSAMQGVDSVIHLAALLHVMNPTPEMREKYERINIGGTATVVDAAIKSGVKRVVLFSTIAVYGPSGNCVLNEMSPTHPDTFYAETKCVAEKIVLNARSSDSNPLGTVLRLGAVYGSRIKGNYEKLTYALARHRFIPIGDGRNRRTLVYDKDVAHAAVLAAKHDDAAGKIYNVSDGQFHLINEIVDAICAALGRPPPRFSLPVAPVRWMAGLLNNGGQVFGLKSPITRGIIDKYTEDIAVDSRRIQKELGFVPQFDLYAGWRDTIQEMRQLGKL